jgi:hypothetical protein
VLIQTASWNISGGGDVLASIVESIGIGAKLTTGEDDTRGPTLVRWKDFSRDDIARPVRQNAPSLTLEVASMTAV